MKPIDVRDPNPIFDIVEGGYYVGVWMLVGPGQDFLGLVFRDPGEIRLQFRYRFRYYVDDKVHFDETGDVKNVYDSDLSGKTDDEAIAIVDDLARGLIEGGYLGTKLPWLVRKRYARKIVRGDHRAMTRALLTMPYTHGRPVHAKGSN